MSILIDENTKVLVQGITGSSGAFHAKKMLEYGTNVVGGVTPGKGGESVHDVPVFDTVADAVDQTGADASVVYVPPAFAADAIMEAADAGIELVIGITEGVPVQDMIDVKQFLGRRDVKFVGPNCPGVISPDEIKIGIMPGNIHRDGNVGVISRSGTLTYEAVDQLTKLGIGQSTCVGIGGDPVNGMGFIDCLEMFEEDDDTDGVVIIGEIGGTAEQEAAAWVEENFSKACAAFVAGKTAPEGKQMGHAGAIISGGSGTAEAKFEAFEQAGIAVAETPAEIGQTMADALD
ncbi:MAG: succinate--CoA ligase subunit alpha [Bradymonadaceae bacterium]